MLIETVCLKIERRATAHFFTTERRTFCDDEGGKLSVNICFSHPEQPIGFHSHEGWSLPGVEALELALYRRRRGGTWTWSHVA